MTIDELVSVMDTHTKLINGEKVGNEQYNNALKLQRQMESLNKEIRSLNRDIKHREELLARTFEERDAARRMATHYMAENSSTSRESFARNLGWNCWDNFKKP